MAKTVKKTRESQYDEILSGLNKTFAQCSVLGFRFPDEAHAHEFHYGLMNAHVDYLLFDSTDDGIAVVIIPKESEQAIKEIQALIHQRMRTADVPGILKV